MYPENFHTKIKNIQKNTKNILSWIRIIEIWFSQRKMRIFSSGLLPNLIFHILPNLRTRCWFKFPFLGIKCSRRPANQKNPEKFCKCVKTQEFHTLDAYPWDVLNFTEGHRIDFTTVCIFSTWISELTIQNHARNGEVMYLSYSS